MTLTASGSATPGAGVVTITNGQGSIVINDTKAETVIFGIDRLGEYRIDFGGAKYCVFLQQMRLNLSL